MHQSLVCILQLLLQNAEKLLVSILYQMMGGHHLSCLVEESEGFRCTSGDKVKVWWFWCRLHFFTVFFRMNILEKHNRFSVFICYKFGFGKFGILCNFFNNALGLWWTFEWNSEGKGRYVLGCALLIQIRIIWAMSMWSVHSFSVNICILPDVFTLQKGLFPPDCKWFR